MIDLTARLALRAPLLAAALLAAGCGAGQVHHHGGSKGPPGPPVFQEVEPNDSPFAADFIGWVNSYSHLFVEGHVEAAPPEWGWDTYDHFEFVADEPLGIEFWLDGWNAGADVDIGLIDPDTGEAIAWWDSPYGNESGYFTVDWPGKAFVLVVETWVWDTGYTLEIAAGPHPGYTPDPDPGAGAAAPAPGPGLSLPEGRPAPEKDAHRDGAPPRGTAREPEAADLARLLDA